MDNNQNTKITDVLKKVKQIELKTNRLLNDGFSGVYKSVFKGQGIDFDELREYTIGDDPRFIDWNVSAKLNKPFIKKFREERELNVMVIVDISNSQSFGSQNASKREFASEIAALLIFSAIKSGDKAGLTLFSNSIEKYIQPKKGIQHGLRLIREILFYENNNVGTDIRSTLTFITNVLKKKSIIFFISDFIDGINQNRLANILKITNTHHDLVCLHVVDENEQNFPQIGTITLIDSETNESIEFDSSNENDIQKISLINSNNLSNISKTFKKAWVDHLLIKTGSDYKNQLNKFLLSRIHRKT